MRICGARRIRGSGYLKGNRSSSRRMLPVLSEVEDHPRDQLCSFTVFDQCVRAL